MKLDTTANNSSFKLAFTGHTNIEKICNVEYIPEKYNKIVFGLIYKEINNKIINLLKQYSKDELVIISGMARGVDEIAAIVAMNQELNLVCAVPHSVEWHKNRKDEGKRLQAIFYDEILKYPKAKIFEIKKSYGDGHKYANFARNAFMVDIADQVLSFKAYDSTGTDHCIAYAKKQNKYMGNLKIQELW